MADRDFIKTHPLVKKLTIKNIKFDKKVKSLEKLLKELARKIGVRYNESGCGGLVCLIGQAVRTRYYEFVCRGMKRRFYTSARPEEVLQHET